MQELSAIGVETDTDWFRHHLGEYYPLDEEVVGILLRWLPRMKHKGAILETMAALTNAKKRFDGTVFADIFDSLEPHNYERWQIASHIESACPLNIENWLTEKLNSGVEGDATQMLILAARKILPKEQARRLVLKNFRAFQVMLQMRSRRWELKRM